MNYEQLNAEERRVLAMLRSLGLSRAEMARRMGRHRSWGGNCSATAHPTMEVTERNGPIRGRMRGATGRGATASSSRRSGRGSRGCSRKLAARTAAEANRALLELLTQHPGRVRTITADNGTEFHWDEQIEAVHPVRFYFATPHHSWERGTNENTNGLIRQYYRRARAWPA